MVDTGETRRTIGDISNYPDLKDIRKDSTFTFRFEQVSQAFRRRGLTA